MRGRFITALVLGGLLAATTGVAQAAERYVLIVSGAAGSPELAAQHAAWRVELVTTLRDKLQMPADRLIILIDKTTSTTPTVGVNADPTAADIAAAMAAAGRGASAGAGPRIGTVFPGSPNDPAGPRNPRVTGENTGAGGAAGTGSRGEGTTGGGRAGAAGAAAGEQQPTTSAADAAAAATRAAQIATEINARALPSTRDNVRATLTKLAHDMKREDVLLVVLFGHSTFDGVDAKFNLVGPDLEASEWEKLVNALPGRVVFVNTTAASAPFMKRLAGQGRVVITATDNPAQKYQTVFPQFFAESFDAKDVDLDKDGRVSIWEAFAYASTQVKQYYRQRGQLSVERPVLDDTGDGVGKESGEGGPDGAIASRTFLDTADDPGAGSGPALSELINRRNVLEGEFDELKRKRSFMPAGDYEKQRDQILIDISRISHDIRGEQRKRS